MFMTFIYQNVSTMTFSTPQCAICAVGRNLRHVAQFAPAICAAAQSAPVGAMCARNLRQAQIAPAISPVFVWPPPWRSFRSRYVCLNPMDFHRTTINS